LSSIAVADGVPVLDRLGQDQNVLFTSQQAFTRAAPAQSSSAMTTVIGCMRTFSSVFRVALCPVHEGCTQAPQSDEVHHTVSGAISSFSMPSTHSNWVPIESNGLRVDLFFETRLQTS